MKYVCLVETAKQEGCQQWQYSEKVGGWRGMRCEKQSNPPLSSVLSVCSSYVSSVMEQRESWDGS